MNKKHMFCVIVVAVVICFVLLFFYSSKAESEPYDEQKWFNVLVDIRDAQNEQAKALTEIVKELKKRK